MKRGGFIALKAGKYVGVSVVLIALLVGCAPPEIEQNDMTTMQVEETAASAKEGISQIIDISTDSLVGKMRITVEADSELTYTAFKLSDPLRLVLDLPQVDTSHVSEMTFADDQFPLMRITPFQFSDGSTMNSRIEIALSHLVPYQVFSDANKLFIDLEVPVEEAAAPPAPTTSALPPGFEELTTAKQPPQASPKPPTVIQSRPEISPAPVPSEPSIQAELPTIQPVPQQPTPQQPQTPAMPSIEIQQPPQSVGQITPLPGIIPTSSTIQDVQVSEVNGKTRVTILTDKLPEFEVKRSQSPPRITVDLKQSDLRPGQEKAITPDDVASIAKRVRVFQLRRSPDGTDNIVRLRVDLLKPSKHEIMTEPGKLVLDIDHSAVFTQAEMAGEEGIVEVPLTTGIEQALDGEDLPEETPTAMEPTIRAPKTGQEKEYKGQLISMHFKEASIIDVLQVIAEVSGLNLVVHPGVTGTVTVNLNNIPWDQALDIVLKMNNLSVEIEGNILRVAQLGVFQQEIAQRVQQQRQQLEARRVQEELEPLETKLITVNFAQPTEIVRIVNEYFQGQNQDAEERRGTITIDQRTKTLVIQDTTANIRTIEEIVATLDRRTPQVMIEARVVTLSSTFRKELGINWSGGLFANPEHGNALDYRFPYSVEVPNFGVNLPSVGSPVGSTGPIRLGSIDDVLTIFARIDAAEQNGKAKVLAQPKIFTQDNIAASVNTGTSFFVVVEGGQDAASTLEEVQATLSLNVTPRISSDGHVSMQVTVTNSAPDFAQDTTNAGVPPILTQTVNSEITVKDGETAVIGGVFQTSEQENFSAVPYLHKIPLIGRLFKSTLPNSRTQSELLVFLTPRILDRQILKPEQESTDVSLSY
ncbi:type IV pilus secretin PilQ [candidate division KSB3 bacterium]|uniref:Type IV pilus secretin PilQ n=1 Tax=candidate division KSB3 bacterium TaxID=2044937 RepID=A0A9D5JZB4_9BACT|nr:type IV pilus secretin PilQ [candidate division KSB3 bacterium]